MSQTALSTTELIESGQRLLHSLAGEIHRKFHQVFEYDDLVAYGQVGLAAAATDFDPSRETRFTTFCYYRVRGAIYEGVGKLSGTTRSQYNKAKFAACANSVQQRGPHKDGDWSSTGNREDASWLSTTTGQMAGAFLLTHCNLGEHAGTLTDDDETTPEERIELEEISARLRATIDDLPDEARKLIEFVYFEGTTLQAAADQLEISKSWASRLHAKTLQLLATSLQK